MGVQGHQNQLENTKVLMEIDVFVCLVVQEPGVPGGAPPPPPFVRNPGSSGPGDMPDASRVCAAVGRRASAVARRPHSHVHGRPAPSYTHQG